MEQVNVFSSENNAVGACARLLVCVENNADSSEKKVMNLIITIIFASRFQHVHVHVLPRRAGDFSRNDDVYEEVRVTLYTLFLLRSWFCFAVSKLP